MTPMIAPMILAACLSYAEAPLRENAPHPNTATQSGSAQQRPADQPATPLKNQPAPGAPNANANNVPPKENPQAARWGAVEWSAVAQAASAVIVTVFTGFLVWYSHRGWRVAKDAANAAKISADAAHDSLRLSAVTFLDLKGHRVIPNMGSKGDVDTLTAFYGIRNLSNNVARDISIRAEYGAGNTMTQEINKRYGLLSPTKGFDFQMNVGGLTPEQQEQFRIDALYIRVRLTISWVDPLNNRESRVFDRVLYRERHSDKWISQVIGSTRHDEG
jgi:hypothetical protein